MCICLTIHPTISLYLSIRSSVYLLSSYPSVSLYLFVFFPSTVFESVRLKISLVYSTLSGKTDKLEEAVNRELNITRSWNFIQTVDLAWFIPRMSFKLICIFYNFKAPLLENRQFSYFETYFIGFGVKNRFRNISSFLNLDYFEKIKISLIIIIIEYAN